MLLQLGRRKLEYPGPQLGELRDCNDLLDDAQALHTRFDEDGYLLIRGLNDRQTVMDARRRIVEYIDEQGQAIAPGSNPMDAVINPDHGKFSTLGQREITHDPAVLAALEGRPMYDFFAHLFGEPAITIDKKWLRTKETGTAGSGIHYDFVFMGQGSQNIRTCWVPLGDIPPENGGLTMCVGSHRLPGFEKLWQTYGQADLERDKLGGGYYTRDPLEVTEKFGGQWKTTSYQAGDVLMFGLHTLHHATNNTTDRWRISCDVRFQPASEPMDDRWAGQNPRGQSRPPKEQRVSNEAAREMWGV